MSNIELTKKFSILPIVDLDDMHIPSDGLVYNTPKDCKVNYSKNNLCQEHYRNLKDNPSFTLTQCPYGFCTVNISDQRARLALTSIIPYPRIGGEGERKMAKLYPDNKIPVCKIKEAAYLLSVVYNHFVDITKNIIMNSSKALHEIRKLNKVVKQTSERLSNQDKDNKSLLTIFKASEMMSQHFDVIELLANENLSSLPLNTDSSLVDLVYKCIHFNILDDKRINLKVEPIYRPKAKVCDKTFNIIPNALIGNAAKYAKKGSQITVEIIDETEYCRINVTNFVEKKLELNENIFDKGIRFHDDNEGTGNGLYVAQLVAKQHNSEIKFRQYKDDNGLNLCVFSFALIVIN